MSVTLTPKVEEEIQQLVESGQFPDADAVVQTVLQALKEQEDAKLDRPRELVRKGFESGPGVELTDELWEEIERNAEERFLRGEKPAPHVCPEAPVDHQSGRTAGDRRYRSLHPCSLGS